MVQQLVTASSDQVYRSWIVPDILASWWWPHIPDARYSIQPAIGGTYRIESEAVGIGVEGEYVALEPPEAIEMTWRWLDEGAPQTEEIVRVALSAVVGGTQVTVIHELADPADADTTRQGWRDVLNRLASLHAHP